MANNFKYKPSRKSIGFRNIGSGLRSAEDRLREQQKIGTDALKVARYQQDQENKRFISGQANKLELESRIAQTNRDFNRKVDKHLFDTTVTHNQSVVDKLSGEAKQKAEYAEWLSKYGAFAPKSLENYTKLAQGSMKLYDEVRGQMLWDSANESGLLEGQVNATEIADLKLKVNMLNDFQKLDSKGQNALYQGGFGNSNNSYGLTILNYKLKNKNLEHDKAKDFINNLEGANYNKNSAVEYMKFYGWQELKRLNISPNSRAGKEIINFYRALGAQDAYRLEGEEQVMQTQSLLNDSLIKYEAQKAIVIDGESDDERRQRLSVHFNMAVLLVQSGTFKDPNTGTILRPGVGKNRTGYNPGTSYEALLGYISANYPDMFASGESMGEEIGQYSTLPNSDGKGGFIPSSEYWGSKHPFRTQRGIDALIESKDNKQKNDLKDKENTADASNIATFNKEYEEKKLEFKGNPRALNQWLSGKVNEAYRETEGTDKYKNHVYQIAGLTEDQFSSALVFSSISAMYYGEQENSTALAFAMFSGLDPSVQQKLAPEFEKFDKVNQSGFSFNGKGPIQSIRALSLLKYQTAEGAANTGSTSKQIGISAQYNRVRYENHVVEEYLTLINSPEYKDPATWNQAMKVAIGIVDVEFADGAYEAKMSDVKKAKYDASRYRRKPASMSSVADGTQVIYLADQLTTKDSEVQRIISIRNAREAMAAKPESDIAIEPFSEENITLIYRENTLVGSKHDSLQWLLSNPRVIDSKTIKSWANLPPGIYFDTLEVPENVTILAKLSGKTEVEIMNMLLKLEGYDRHIEAGSEDALILQNDGRLIPNRRSDIGLSMWCAARSQNCYPISMQGRAYYDRDSWANVTDPTSTLEAEWDFKQEYWKKTNDSYWSKDPNTDLYNFENPSTFIENGGFDLNMDTPTKILESLNLTPSLPPKYKINFGGKK